MTSSAVGIVCALESEARHLSRSRPVEPVSSLIDGTLLAVSGMGGAAAARSAHALIEAGATALASFGLAGGLDPALAAGTIFLPSEVIAPDGLTIETACLWRDQVRTALDAHLRASRSKRGRSAAVAAHCCVAHGKLLTSPRAIGSVADKAQLFSATGAAAVDMESVAIAQVARIGRLPFIAVRVIVDSAADFLPRAVMAAADGAGHLQLGRLIGALARAPADLAPMLRLAHRYRAASRSLAAVARANSLASHAFWFAPDAGIS